MNVHARFEPSAKMKFCAHLLFETQVAKTPNAVALIFSGQAIAYHELNEGANRIARTLQTYGIGPESRVGLHGDRSLKLILALLAVLKAGGAYVHIDATYSNERKRQMAAQAEIGLVLFDPTAAPPPNCLESCLSIDHLETESGRKDSSNLSISLTTDSLSCVTFTSGTTGVPKGVEHNHSCLTHYIPALEPDDVCALNTSLGFTSSFARLFAPLSSGIPVVLLPSETVKDVNLFLHELQRTNVTTIGLVPSLLRQILDRGPGISSLLNKVRAVTVGGDAITPDIVSKFRDLLPNARILHGFGSSETCAATLCDFTDLTEFDTRCIGVPLPNTVALILDADLHEVPIYTQGTLYIGGSGLARGYIGQPTLTDEKFIQSPFPAFYERLFNTGDLARYRLDGQIELLGRADDQVKIRGFRVTFSELEAVLANHTKVKEVAVAGIEENNEVRLFAYVVAKEPVQVSELRKYMQSKLPEYSVPARFVVIDHLPLTATGKVDRHALTLSEFTRTALDVPYREAVDELERELVVIWSQALGVEDIGLDDEFLELGGDSLIGIRLAVKIEGRYGVRLNLRDILSSPTVALLAEFLRSCLATSSDTTKSG